MFDVNVPHPCSQHYLKRTFRDPKYLIAKNEKQKRKKHARYALKNGAMFFPLICETFGATGPGVEQFYTLIARLAREQDPHSIEAPKLAVKAARQEVAVAIQYGVAKHVEHMYALSLPLRRAISRTPQPFGAL
jgi:hypothetical protein